jgi:hypothetical protein
LQGGDAWKFYEFDKVFFLLCLMDMFDIHMSDLFVMMLFAMATWHF